MALRIKWPSGSILIDREWASFKKVFNGTEKKLKLQVEEESSHYNLFCVDTQIIYRCLLYKDGFEPAGWTSEEIDANTTNLAEYLASYSGSTNKSNILIDETGKLLTAVNIPVGEEFMYVTHNFCDPTTWYQQSERITSGALSSLDGSGISFSLGYTNIIDITHGKIYQEDSVAATVNHGYSVQIYDSGYLLTERTPFESSGGDYTLNYRTGIVTFSSGHSINNLLANFSYATNSIFIFAPVTAQTELNMTYVEAQFDTDFTFNTAIIGEIYGYAEVFAPQLGLPPGTKIPLLTLKYKTLGNVIEEAKGSYPLIPIMGGSARGLTTPRFTFPFIYTAARRIKYDYGMEMRIHLENDIPFGGDYCSLTFYGNIESSNY